MEFLVQIDVSLPPGLTDDEREVLLARERERGRALKRAGTIVRIWRIPGRLANVGIWRGVDADEVHAALTSLPVFRYADIRVTALATHYLEAEGREL